MLWRGIQNERIRERPVGAGRFPEGVRSDEVLFDAHGTPGGLRLLEEPAACLGAWRG